MEIKESCHFFTSDRSKNLKMLRNLLFPPKTDTVIFQRLKCVPLHATMCFIAPSSGESRKLEMVRFTHWSKLHGFPLCIAYCRPLGLPIRLFYVSSDRPSWLEIIGK